MDPDPAFSKKFLDLPDPKIQNATFLKNLILFDFCITLYYFELLNKIVFFYWEQKNQKKWERIIF
jgi:hypothetical protein